MKSKTKKLLLSAFSLICMMIFISQKIYAVNLSPIWYVDAPCLTHGAAGAFDEISVKDPSIVYYGGKYHLFFTGVTSAGWWQMGYTSATTIAGLSSAPHTFLSKISENYFCAPQVFYFEPQNKWYMIYNDGTYGAAYATTTNIADPNSWVGPQSLGVPSPTGYDFFIICDDSYAYLFNTQDNGRNILWRRTPLANFPAGWSGAQVAATDTFEGVIVYKSLADGKYYMLPEDYYDNRYYELWTATSLSGPWTKLAEQWASYHNLVYNAEHWTDNVSHGEIIRAGYNQKLEINDIDRVDFIIQGVRGGNHPEYVKIPWELGVIRNYISQSSTPTPTQTPTPTPTSIITPVPRQSPIWTGGPYNLNGTSDYVDVPDGITNNLGDISITCWVKLNAVTNWVRIFDFGGDSNIFMMLTPQSANTTFPYFAITTTGNSGEQGLNGKSVLATGSWQHLAIVKSGTTGILYINNQEVDRNAAITIKPADLGNTVNNYIGRSQWSHDPYLNAGVDKFKIYNRAIATTEVAALFADSPESIKGDVNGDGADTIVDAMLIARYASGLNTAGFNSVNADVNCDNTVNINDALLVARYAAGLVTSLGC